LGSGQYLKRARREPRAGKVEVLLDAELKGVEWGEFRIGDLFEKINLRFKKSIFDKDNDISKKKSLEFNLPLVNAKDGDNGVMYYGREKDFESIEMSIDIVNDGAISTGNVYSQPQKTGVLYNAYLIKLKFNVTEKLLHFLTSTIKKSIKHKFGYENKASWTKVKKEYIQLPTKNNEIDFEFMENFIAELEAQKIARLEAYLVENGLKEYRLSDEEEEVLRDFESGKLNFKEFKVKELFEINTYKKRFDANKITLLENGKPYVARGSSNNGVKGYIIEDEQFLNDGNTISFGQDTATMFYQEKPYFTGDKIKILKSKVDEFNKLNGLFLVTTMTKSFSSFSWGGSSFNIEIIGNQLMKLPTKNNQPDYALMQTLVSAVQKLVAKDVVLYVQRKLNQL